MRRLIRIVTAVSAPACGASSDAPAAAGRWLIAADIDNANRRD